MREGNRYNYASSKKANLYQTWYGINPAQELMFVCTKTILNKVKPYAPMQGTVFTSNLEIKRNWKYAVSNFLLLFYNYLPITNNNNN